MHDSFFDTNTLLYVFSADLSKAARAEDILAAGGVVSVQVLNEFANVARRKMNLSWAELRTALETFKAILEVRPLTLEIHETGLRLAERYKLPVYDALIAAAAIDAGCSTLWSEDLQHGLILEKRLTVINPFSPAA